MRKRIPVKYIDTTVYEGGKIPNTLIHLNGMSYYIESYAFVQSVLLHVSLKVWKPF